jgi:hypothetical protein
LANGLPWSLGIEDPSRERLSFGRDQPAAPFDHTSQVSRLREQMAGEHQRRFRYGAGFVGDLDPNAKRTEPPEARQRKRSDHGDRRATGSVRRDDQTFQYRETRHGQQSAGMVMEDDGRGAQGAWRSGFGAWCCEPVRRGGAWTRPASSSAGYDQISANVGW